MPSPFSRRWDVAAEGEQYCQQVGVVDAVVAVHIAQHELRAQVGVKRVPAGQQRLWE
jgi:hypothetical protein